MNISLFEIYLTIYHTNLIVYLGNSMHFMKLSLEWNISCYIHSKKEIKR